MSQLKITKGDPYSFLVNITQNGTVVNINDGTWTVYTKIRYQTAHGNEPFTVEPSVSDSGLLITLTGDQTALLNTLGTGYVFLIKCVKNDGTVTLTNTVYMQVFDDFF